MDASLILHEKGSSEESFGHSFISTLHKKDSTEEHLGAYTGIGSSGSVYTVVGSNYKLPLVQLGDIEELLEAASYQHCTRRIQLRNT